MGLYPYGAQCCNNCWYWQCHAKRSVRGNPPKEIYTDSNCDKCSRTDRSTLSKDCCSGFLHFDGATITFPLRGKSEPNHGETFYNSMLGLAEAQLAKSRRDRLAVEERVRSPQVCNKCGGSGRVECSDCGGSGKVDCSDCEGKGGFAVSYQIREIGKIFTRQVACFLDPVLDAEAKSGFWKEGWDWESDSARLDEFEGCREVFSKRCEVSVTSSYRKIQEEVLNVSLANGDFRQPLEISENDKLLAAESHSKTFGDYIAKCKEIEADANKWGGSARNPEERLREATLRIIDVPCIVEVKFKDRYGFKRTALVNLSNNKAYLCDVSEEECNRRMPELVKEAGGDLKLQNILGMMYAGCSSYKGYAPKDAELAVGWYGRAAKAGLVDAMDNMGCCYKNGNGVQEDKKLAASWYARAAKGGYPIGQCHYADYYYEKDSPDRELAFGWYLKSALNGCAEAMYAIGCMYSVGDGVVKDVELGTGWKERAKANGYEVPQYSKK